MWTSLKHERLTAQGIREIADAAHDLTGAIQPLGQALDAGFEGSLETLAKGLAGLKVLVVFDNLETIGGLDFTQLYETLPDSVAYLVTSRIGVGEYERRYPLTPLSPRDSLRLFNVLFVHAGWTVSSGYPTRPARRSSTGCDTAPL